MYATKVSFAKSRARAMVAATLSVSFSQQASRIIKRKRELFSNKHLRNEQQGPPRATRCSEARETHSFAVPVRCVVILCSEADALVCRLGASRLAEGDAFTESLLLRSRDYGAFSLAAIQSHSRLSCLAKFETRRVCSLFRG